MSGLLDNVARRLASEGAQSRRDFLFGAGQGRARSESESDAGEWQQGRQPDAYDRPGVVEARRGAPGKDLEPLRQALVSITPPRHEMDVFLAALKQPRSDGRMNLTAVAITQRQRVRVRAARKRVSKISPQTREAGHVLQFLDLNDTILGAFVELANTVGPYVTRPISSRAAEAGRKADAVAKILSKELG